MKEPQKGAGTRHRHREVSRASASPEETTKGQAEGGAACGLHRNHCNIPKEHHNMTKGRKCLWRGHSVNQIPTINPPLKAPTPANRREGTPHTRMGSTTLQARDQKLAKEKWQLEREQIRYHHRARKRWKGLGK